MSLLQSQIDAARVEADLNPLRDRSLDERGSQISLFRDHESRKVEIDERLRHLGIDVAAAQRDVSKLADRSVAYADSVGHKLYGMLNEISVAVSELEAFRANDAIGKVDLNYMMRCIAALERSIGKTTDASDATGAGHDAMAAALSGDMVLTAQGTVRVSAAALNAAIADAIDIPISCILETADGLLQHSWCNLDPLVITSTKGDVADADVGNPVPKATDKKLTNGNLVTYWVTADTDAGATKTYVSGEQMDATIKVAADDLFLTHTISALVIPIDIVD